MTDDYEELRDWMARPDVRAAVARRLAEADEEEPPEMEQLAMSLDAPPTGPSGGRAEHVAVREGA